MAVGCSQQITDVGDAGGDARLLMRPAATPNAAMAVACSHAPTLHDFIADADPLRLRQRAASRAESWL